MRGLVVSAIGVGVGLLGVIGGVFILTCGLLYLNWRRRQATGSGEGYGDGHDESEH